LLKWGLPSPENPAKSPSGRRTHMPHEASLMFRTLRAVLLALTHMYVVLRPSHEGGRLPPRKSCKTGQHRQ
jgi:hypothetical protein